jgi:hypothetical protein
VRRRDDEEEESKKKCKEAEEGIRGKARAKLIWEGDEWKIKKLEYMVKEVTELCHQLIYKK